MKKILALAAVLAAGSFAQTAPPKVGWSLGYYCGWDQGSTPPDKVNWKAFTHVAHFTVFPTAAGELDLSIGEFTDARCKAAVDAAHAAGVKIVICFGGAGVADRFKGATSPANIHKFVKNMLDFMRKYGYDGIDTDWEENFDNAQMLAWHKELRDSINNITPRPSLTAATGGYFVNNCYFIHPYVEMMNTMSYDIALSGMSSEMARYTSKGVPKEKLGVGIGIGSGGSMQETDSNKAKGKVMFAIAGGFGGVMQWAVRSNDDRHISIFKMLEQYVPARTTMVWDNGRRHEVLSGMLSVDPRGRVRYSAPPGGASVDIGLYDLNGTRIGVAGSGRYVVRLNSGATTQSTITSIIR